MRSNEFDIRVIRNQCNAFNHQENSLVSVYKIIDKYISKGLGSNKSIKTIMNKFSKIKGYFLSSTHK